MASKVASQSLDIARQYLEFGYSPIPDCGPDHNCDSPGKTPHLSGWSRFSETPPTDAELIRFFKHHQGNIGIAVRQGQIVLDIDARSGGLESIELLQAIHGELPDTPIVETGGGGLHYYMTIPEGYALKAGGSLTNVGSPGVEWKGARGHVVAPPSIHVSGYPYSFQVDSNPRVSPPAPAPQWLLDLVSQAQIHDSGGARPRKADGSRASLSKEEVAYVFKRTYTEGERRVASGLPKIVGLLISRKVPLDKALAFLETWQADHFFPELDLDQLTSQVTGMYNRYGHPQDGTESQGDAFVRWITGQVSHTPPGHPSTVKDATKVVEEKRRDRAKRRNTNLYEARDTAAEWWHLQPDGGSKAGLMFPISNSGESKARFMTSDLNFNIPDPRLIPNKDELYVLMGRTDEKKLRDIETCLYSATNDCIVHGPQGDKTRTTCKQPSHYWCTTKTGNKIRQLELEDLAEVDGCYRNVRIRWAVNTEGMDQVEKEGVFEMEREDLAHRVHVISKRKAVKGQLLHWSMAVGLARPWVVFEARLFFHQTEKVAVDHAIETVRARLDGIIWSEAVFQDGEHAVVQLYEDVSSTLIAMTDKEDFGLFGAYYWGTKGKTMAQGLDSLWNLLKEVEPEEPARCPVPGCGRRLRLRVITPEEEAQEEEEKRAAADYKPPPETLPLAF